MKHASDTNIGNDLEINEVNLDNRHHSFPLSIAKKYSIPMALWLSHIAHWTENNLSNNKNIHDGLCWSYNTLEALGDQFDYLTKSQRETMINNSIKEGLVVKGNYNKSKYDRTTWYALTPKAYAFFPFLLLDKYMKRLYSSISENSEMDFAEFGNQFPKIRTPIPDTKPDTKPYNKNNISDSDESLNEGYNQNENLDLNKKSDYQSNHDTNDNEGSITLCGKDKKTKSDYFESQIKNKPNGTNNKSSAIKTIINNNPHQIPREFIDDWIANRKLKKAAVTQTAWNKLNKELAKCADPIAAFEEMVAGGWLSLKADWVNSKSQNIKKSFFDHESTKWAEGIEQDMF